MNGPTYCQMCLDVNNYPRLGYDDRGNGKCAVCLWEYKFGTQWVITDEDVDRISSDIEEYLT